MKRKPHLQEKGTCNATVTINDNDPLSPSRKVSVAGNLSNYILGKEKYPDIPRTTRHRCRLIPREPVSSWLPIRLEACESS